MVSFDDVTVLDFLTNISFEHMSHRTSQIWNNRDYIGAGLWGLIYLNIYDSCCFSWMRTTESIHALCFIYLSLNF